jgi:hypothetical protein
MSPAAARALKAPRLLSRAELQQEILEVLSGASLKADALLRTVEERSGSFDDIEAREVLWELIDRKKVRLNRDFSLVVR